MKNYAGGCHCGKVRYTVQMDLENAPAMDCNCSRCSKLGGIITFVPEEQFTLLSGESDLTEYLFNKNSIHHLFCATCGIESFARGVGKESVSTYCVNLLCIDDLDLSTLTVTHANGKDF